MKLCELFGTGTTMVQRSSNVVGQSWQVDGVVRTDGPSVAVFASRCVHRCVFLHMAVPPNGLLHCSTVFRTLPPNCVH
ncbi:hypothetical protein KM043_005620 [Ampulex compressa]|nr:hypothetical protein KM043_005620 [Ampulex compressa]